MSELAKLLARAAAALDDLRDREARKALETTENLTETLKKAAELPPDIDWGD